MKRKCLVAAVSLAPLVLIAAGQAHAQLTISTAINTPVATATAVNNAPADINIVSGGSVGITSPGVAVTINSSNSVTNGGEIGFTAVDNAIGIQVQGGNTGNVVNSASILVTDNYTATTDNNTGLLELPYAQGTNRTDIQVVGPGVVTGSITNISLLTVHGDASFGVDIQAPITGDYTSLQVTPATSTAAESVLIGSITTLGGEPALNGVPATLPTIGFHIGPNGGVGGSINIANVSATGYGTQAILTEGTVGGAVNLSGVITATGYRATARTNTPSVAAQYTALEMTQGGSAVTIAGSVGQGIILSAPPLTAITDASTASDVINGVSILQTLQGTGTISTFGGAPSLVIGSPTKAIEVGVLNPANNTILGTNAALSPYGLAIQGNIIGNGVFDQYYYHNLPAPVHGIGMRVGSTGGFAAKIDGGIYNTGAISGQSYQANATGIHFTSGGATPLIVNDGVIQAISTQENSNKTVVLTGGVVAPVIPVNVNGILIDSGATVGSIVNHSSIIADITGNGGVGGVAGAIIDHSGTLANVTNTGVISAQATQTLVTAQMPITPTAIDMSAGVGPQTITQSFTTDPIVLGAPAYNATITYSQGQIINYLGLVYQATTSVNVAIDPIDYPGYWRQIGATAPYINGSVLMGSGGSSLTVQGGTVNGAVINLGTGSNNVLTVNGPSNLVITATTVTGGIEEVSGALAQSQVAGLGSIPLQGGGNGTMTINVNNGVLIDLNPNTEYVSSVNVGSNGLLVVAADPTRGVNTHFITSGSSTFASGADLGISLLSFAAKQEVLTILETAPGGTLSVGTFGSSGVNNAPWLYTATPSYLPSTGEGVPSEIQLTVTQKSSAELGFNNAEAAGLDAVLAAAPANPDVQASLLAQTTEAGFKKVYDQLLPMQGQGLFDAIDAAAQAVSGMTGAAPAAATRVAGTSLWLQEVNERVDRQGVETLGSFTKLFGLVAGYEHSGERGGATGVTLAYYNVNEQNDADQIGLGIVSSMVEAGAYYRRTVGRFSVSARAAIGYAWYDENRVFASEISAHSGNSNSATGTELTANSNWGGLFYDGHFGANYEQPFGHFYARPEISADFLQLNEGAHSDTGGGDAFDLNVASRDSSRLSGQAIIVFGRQWGQVTWLRAEIDAGYRQIFAGSIGDTVANFNGGNPFTLVPDSEGGWFTAGFSIRGGSPYSYMALEGNVDLQAGEQRYDLRIAGRSIF